MRILQSMLTALVNAPVRMAALGWRQPPRIDEDPEAAVDAVLSAAGEVSSLVYASSLLDQIEAMDDSDLAALTTQIATRFDLNGNQLARAAASYRVFARPPMSAPPPATPSPATSTPARRRRARATRLCTATGAC